MTARGLADRLRWRPAREPVRCDACGAGLERGAAWCGGCGARTGQQTGAAAVPEVPVDTSASAPPSDRTAGRRRWGIAVGAIGLAAAVLAAGLARDPAPVALLGTATGAAGLSASGPPPVGLRLAWSVPLGDGPQAVTADGLPRVVVGDRRVAVDGRVADLGTGRLVATVPEEMFSGDDGVGVLLTGSDLVRFDVLEGRVLGRVPVPRVDPSGTAVVARSEGVTVLTDFSAEETVLVDDDGRELARHRGVVTPEIERAVDAPVAVNVRSGHEGDAGSRLVALADGRVVTEVETGVPQVVDVVGDRALVAAAVTGGLGAPGAGIVWGLRLVDAGDGSTVAQARVVSEIVPRLLGSFDDGAAAIVTRAGDEVTAWRLAGDAVDGLVQLRRNQLRTPMGMFDDAFFLGASATLRSVAMVDGVVVLHDVVAERVVAVDGGGAEVWSRPTSGTVVVAADRGHVVLVAGDGRARVLDARDGTDVTTAAPLDPAPLPPWAPVALLGTDLALAPPAVVGLDVSVGTVRWIDVVTGEERSAEDVLGDLAPADESVSGNWRLVGVDDDPLTGGTAPVVLRDLGRDVVQLLEVGEGFRTVDLDQPDGGDVASFLARVVGVADGRVALWTNSFEGQEASVTHVVDRVTEEVLHLRGVTGLALRSDLLLGVDGERGELLGLDPVTGAERWTAPMPWDFFATVLDDGLLVEPGADVVAALGLDDGRAAWRHDADVLLDGRAVLGSGSVVVAGVDGEVMALGRADGTPVWRTALDVPVTAMTGAGDHVLLGTADGLVVHLDERGREVQRIAVGSTQVRALAALGQTVVAVVDGAAVGLRTDGSGVVRRDEVDLP